MTGQPAANYLFIAPQDWGRDSLRRREIAAGQTERFAREAIRGPVRHRNPSSLPGDPRQLRGNLLRTESEHGAEHAHYQVEVAVGIRQILSVPFFETNRQSL